jgi:hypothetical protein
MTTSSIAVSRTPLILRIPFNIFRGLAQYILKKASDKVKRRWFGSDVFEPYTACYTWLANQLGHFTIGAFLYGLAWVPSFIVANNQTAACPAHTGGAAFHYALGFAGLLWLVYIVKEVADIVHEDDLVNDLCKDTKKKGRPFPADQREVALDGWTDCFFVAFGIVFAHGSAWIMSNIACVDEIKALHINLNTSGGWWWLLPIALGIAYAIERGWHYLPQKNRFDASGLPFYFRLARFCNDPEGDLWTPGTDRGARFDEERGIEKEIKRVASGDQQSWCVCIFGPGGSGKTALAVGIACDLILGERKVGERKVRYVAADDLTTYLPSGPGVAHKKDGLLPLDEARWFIVDHVSPSGASQVIDAAERLAKRRPEAEKPVFIFTCDHEKAEQTGFVRDLTSRLNMPCLVVHLEGLLPRYGSLVSNTGAGLPVAELGGRTIAPVASRAS